MSVFERVKQDEASGDLASAKNRLASHAVTTRFDPRICEQIARICLRMQNPTEAGRWYFLSESADSEAEPSIQKFARSCGENPRQILSQMPHGSLTRPIDQYAPAVAARLRRLGYVDPGTSPPPVPETWSGKLMIAIVLAVVLAVLGMIVIGFITVVGWLM